MFKVGDKVHVIDAETRKYYRHGFDNLGEMKSLKNSDILTITRIYNYNCNIVYAICSKFSRSYCFNSSELKLVPKFTVKIIRRKIYG